MKKNFVRVMLFGALTLTVSTVVTSCKDYDDDIKGLQEQVDKITSTSPVSTEDMKNAVEKAKQDLQTQLNDLSALVENPDGEKTLKEKKSLHWNKLWRMPQAIKLKIWQQDWQIFKIN